jgi:hypothetical protein
MKETDLCAWHDDTCIFGPCSIAKCEAKGIAQFNPIKANLPQLESEEKITLSDMFEFMWWCKINYYEVTEERDFTDATFGVNTCPKTEIWEKFKERNK